jgi:2,4-dienoyl-CoA reductase-like NADH-dependent reductase (Old Yellow Enzyme family)
LTATPALFEPFTIRNLTLRNRIWVAPMCQYSVLQKDGIPTTWHLVHLGALATGGSALVISEATAVTAVGRISPRDTGIWNDEQRDAWKPITDFIHSQGAAAGIQLAHAGRKASTYPAWGFEQHGTVPSSEGGWPTVSASAIAFPGYGTPAALDGAGIDDIVDAFADGAARAVSAGFDLLEIHAAHGYLVHQFLSPLSNQRTDHYGGSLENRARILIRMVAAIRARVGDDVPLLVRFSATDWTEGGWDEQQTSTVAGWAKDAGADFFDISSGGNVAATIPLKPGYQVPFAEYVRATADVSTSAVGLITEPQQAEDIVASGKADVIMLARELLRDPHWPLRAAHELGAEIDYWPAQYVRAKL